MASVTDSSKRHGAMGVDFLSIFIFGLCVARGDAPLSGALVSICPTLGGNYFNQLAFVVCQNAFM